MCVLLKVQKQLQAGALKLKHKLLPNDSLSVLQFLKMSCKNEPNVLHRFLFRLASMMYVRLKIADSARQTQSCLRTRSAGTPEAGAPANVFVRINKRRTERGRPGTEARIYTYIL